MRSRDPLHTSPGVSVNLKDPSGDEGLLHNTRRSQPGRNLLRLGWCLSRARACPQEVTDAAVIEALRGKEVTAWRLFVN